MCGNLQKIKKVLTHPCGSFRRNVSQGSWDLNHNLPVLGWSLGCSAMQNSLHCMQRADRQLRNICSGGVIKTGTPYCATALPAVERHRSLRVSGFKPLPRSIPWHRRNSILPVKEDLPLTPTPPLPTTKWGAAIMEMCVWGGKRECTTGGMCTCSFFFLVWHSWSFVGTPSQADVHKKVMAPALYVPQRKIDLHCGILHSH